MNRRRCALVILFFLAATPYLPATILTVTSPADTGPGTLRNQVAASASGDTIQFAIPGLILLNSSITIDHSLYVQGPGVSKLAINASHLDRAFITVGNDDVFFSDLTISNGFIAAPNGPDGGFGQNGGPGADASGGAILDYSVSLELSNCWVTGNSVQGGHGGHGGSNPIGAAFTIGNGGPGGGGAGGALYATGAVVLVNCTFSANQAIGGSGGFGGTNFNGSVNESGGAGGAAGFAQGGAIDMVDGVTKGQRQFQNCTFSGNLTGLGVGGNGGDSFNGAGGNGGAGGSCGGGAIASVLVDLLSCTIVSNTAVGGNGGLGGLGGPPGTAGSPGGGTAGGVIGYTITCQSDIQNTILADNAASSSSSNFFIGFIDEGANFFGTDDQLFCSPNDPTTRFGTILNPLHPQLGPLAQNGSGLPTHAVLLTSPVLDAGDNFGFATDERGAPRTYDFPSVPNYLGGDGTDVGAFELGNPDLGLDLSSTNAVLSWPAYYGDFLLQTATNLSGSNTWTTVSNPPTVIGTQLIITNPTSAPLRFYRLSNH